MTNQVWVLHPSKTFKFENLPWPHCSNLKSPCQSAIKTNYSPLCKFKQGDDFQRQTFTKTNMTKVHLFRIRYVHFFRLETSPFQMAKFVFLDTPTKNEVRTFPKHVLNTTILIAQ